MIKPADKPAETRDTYSKHTVCYQTTDR